MHARPTTSLSRYGAERVSGAVAPGRQRRWQLACAGVTAR
jgi:hypothetical protein